MNKNKKSLQGDKIETPEFIINNHLDDTLEGEDYDCNYILGYNTIKDIKEPLNIVFLISLFMICVRIYFGVKSATM